MFWREGEDGWEMARINDRTNKWIECERITCNEGIRIKLRISFRNFMLNLTKTDQRRHTVIFKINNKPYRNNSGNTL